MFLVETEESCQVKRPDYAKLSVSRAIAELAAALDRTGRIKAQEYSNSCPHWKQTR